MKKRLKLLSKNANHIITKNYSFFKYALSLPKEIQLYIFIHLPPHYLIHLPFIRTYDKLWEYYCKRMNFIRKYHVHDCGDANNVNFANTSNNKINHRINSINYYSTFINHYKLISRVFRNDAVPHRIRTDQSDITDISLSKNQFACASDDCTVVVGNIDNTENIKVYKSHVGGVWACLFVDDDGKTDSPVLVTASTDRTVHLRSLVTDNLQKLKAHKSTVRVLLKTQNHFISGGRDGHIKVWAKNGVLVESVRGHRAAVRSMCHYNGMVVSGGYDGRVLVWNVNESVQKCKSKLITLSHSCNKHMNRVYTVLITSSHILSAGCDGMVNISDHSGKLLFRIDGHRGVVPWVIVVQGYQENDTSRIYDNDTVFNDTVKNTLIYNTISSKNKVNDKYIISAGSDGQIRLTSLANTLLLTIREYTPITAIYHCNGLLFVGVCHKVSVYVIDYVRGNYRGITLCDGLCAVYRIVGWNGRIVVGCKKRDRVELLVYDYDEIRVG